MDVRCSMGGLPPVRRSGALSLAVAVTGVCIIALAGCAPQHAGGPWGQAAAPYGTVSVVVHWPSQADLTRGVGPATLEAEVAEGRVRLRAIHSATQRIDISISGPDFSPPIQASVDRPQITGAVTSIEIAVPPGTGRQLLAIARNGFGDALSGGTAHFDVAPGARNQVPVELLRGPADAQWPLWGGHLSNSRLTALVGPGNTFSGTIAAGIGPGGTSSGFVVGPDGTRYLASTAGIGAYSPGSNVASQVWSGPSATQPLAICRNGDLIAAYMMNAMRVLAANGQAAWLKSLASTVVTAPTISPRGIAYFPCEDGIVYGLDVATGAELMRFPLTGKKGVYTGHPAIDAKGNVYVCNADPRMYAFDGVTGEQLWAFNGGDALFGPALGPNGMAYCASASGYVFGVSMSDGTQRWMYPESTPAGPFASGPAIGPDGTVYIGDQGTTAALYALDGDTGALRWQWPSASLPSGSPTGFAGSPLVDGAGYVFIANEDAIVYRRRGSDGADGGDSGSFGGGQGATSPVIDADGYLRWSQRTGNQMYFWHADP